MDRPYIICHMSMSIDGKVTGQFLNRNEFYKTANIYYDLHRNYKTDGFICGRVTMEESFTHSYYPDLNQYLPTYSKEDYIDHLSHYYAITFDTTGKLGWKDNIIHDEDIGYDQSQIIEVLTYKTDPRYLTYLKSLNISYIFAGDEYIDIIVALKKLKHHFHINTLLLEGGSIINGSFIQNHLIDELSLVIDPSIGYKDDKPLFTNASLHNFQLDYVHNYNGILHLKYIKDKK